DGRRVVYNRIWTNFRTWKRYRGGMTLSLWIYDLAGNRLEPLTENDSNSTEPVWIGDRIIFDSDRDKTFNLFSVDPGSKKVTKLTDHKDYDVRWASGGPDGVVYENGGDVYVYDIAAAKSARVGVRGPGERPAGRPGVARPSGWIGRGAARHDRRALLALRTGLVARQQKARLRRQGPEAVLGRRPGRQGHARRPGEGGGDQRLRLVPGQPLPGLLEAAPGPDEAGLSLCDRDRQGDASDVRDERQPHSRLRPRGPLPLLSLRPRPQRRGRGVRLFLCLRQRDADLRRDAAQGPPFPVRPRVGRGAGRRGGEGGGSVRMGVEGEGR